MKLDGPLSLFKLNRRYGTALAKVLPEIVKGEPWTLNAQILHKWSNKLLSFQLESARHRWLFPEALNGEVYDSAVEREFAEDFFALGSKWTLRREPEPVTVADSIMLPDFAFQLGSTKVFLEIVGLWTKHYLEKKIEKLRWVRDSTFILAVDENLACEKLKKLQGFTIVYYKNRIPARAIAKLLQQFEAEEAARQIAKVQLEVNEPVATISQLAEKAGVMKEVVWQSVAKVRTHVLIGETLVEKELADTIRRCLDREIGDREVTLPHALSILEKHNLPEPLQMLTHCGYKVKWHGILMENAKVAKFPS